MPDVETPALVPATLGRMLLSRLDRESAEAIMAACRDELRQEVHEHAVAEARAALEQEFNDRHEALLDALAQQRRQIEQDAVAVADAEAAKQLEIDREEFSERLDELRARLRDWRRRAETAEGLCYAILSQLLGGVDRPPVYLRSITGEGLTALDRHAANEVLQHVGVQVKSKATASSRVVQVTTEPGKVVPHTIFWLTKAPGPGVVDEDAEAHAEDQASPGV